MIRYCPVCNSNTHNNLIEIKFPDNKKITGLPEIYSIVECSNCYCIYSRFDADKLDFYNYYNNKSTYGSTFASGGEHTEDRMSQYNYISNYISNYFSKDAYICDIGVGAGGLLTTLKNNGFKNIFAIEPSKKCNEILLEHGINIININDIESYNSKYYEKFDFIILSHVLEHIWNAKVAMYNISLYLKEDGMIFLEVPNSNKYIEFYQYPYHFFNYEHITHFNYTSIYNLTNILDLKIIDSMECVSLNFPSIRFLIKRNKKIMQKSYNDELYKYIEKSKSLNKVIEKFISSYEEIVLWGIGSSSLQLLSLGLEKCNIVNVVDSSLTKQGSYVLNFKINSPDTILDYPEATILVLPSVYSLQIMNQIEQMGLKNKVEFLTRPDQTRPDQTRPDQTRPNNLYM